jgi:hypothetical protein
MVKCYADGKHCYWYSSKRKWLECQKCGWACDEKVHPDGKLCAACFEDHEDAENRQDSNNCYPACKGTECRAKTQVQRARRDKAMSTAPKPPQEKRHILPPPPPLSRSVPAASSSSAASTSSYYEQTRASPAGAAGVDVRVLKESLHSMRLEIQSVSTRMDTVMRLIDTLRQAVYLSHSVQPESFQ